MIDATKGLDTVPADGVYQLERGQAVIPHNVARYGISHADYYRTHGAAEYWRAYKAGELPKIVEVKS